MTKHWRLYTLLTVCLLAALAPSAFAQDEPTGVLADVSGPGQPVPQPAAQCPHTIACQYAEQMIIPSGYRIQSLQVCGANCTTQYWVAAIDDGQQLLEIDPIRGGAVLAVERSQAHPSVRVVMPTYAPNDPACCPSSYSDTRFAWDASSGTLVAGDSVSTPSDQFPGYGAARQELSNEGWLVASV
jgi:LppP/LprE lipoprotein